MIPAQAPRTFAHRSLRAHLTAMKDEKLMRERFARLRGEFLNWGTPEAQASVTTKDELRGWIRALEWVLGRQTAEAAPLSPIPPPRS